ncbi:MAG: hypothetical protein NZ518_06530, partial [Dehalococcoidia bacterium]|nr:hypothetical protein [Dehalococcoidia bacterium]
MWRFLLVVTMLAATLPAATVARADMIDYDIPNGRFFSQTAPGPLGFSVIDDTAPFWTTFRQFGGVDTIGYPISRRFLWDGQPAQAFQKGVMHWRPDLKRVVFVNVFDQLSKYGKDAWLRDVRLVPPPKPLPDESSLDFATITQRRLALLDAYPDIRAKYRSSPDPLTFFGLPMAPPEDYGSVVVVRLQRAVIQQWKTPRPWANAGDVTIANGGDVGKEAGLFPTA